MLKIDGQDGGGQLLRTSLSLSLVTGEPFSMTAIRGQRAKPGLMRQHLTAVNAAIEISGGSADGAVLGSTELVFAPQRVKGGDYRFSIGTAGSTCLLYQALLPALLLANEPSTLRLEGGTHNPMAPTFDFLSECFLPVLQKMGADVELELERYGFYPAGGGSLLAKVEPCTGGLKPIELLDRGKPLRREIRVISAHVPDSVGEREGAIVLGVLEAAGWGVEGVSVRSVDSAGAGNVVCAALQSEQVCEMTIAFGERGKSGKRVAHDAAKAMRDYLGTGAVVGRRLADQLLLPIALAGAGEFLTMKPSKHTLTNAALIQQFLDVKIDISEQEDGQWKVSVSPSA
ncbi:MAG: RNA 3'-terminal phosphate cyclase [Verrucomicrobiae bacterium]|nr:RNA 3'-terminal phosphate cyclase [Verrucomicrobiae bacterium]